MTVEADVTAARAAVRDLKRAVEGLRRSHPDSVDVRRLAVDADRLGEDLDLLLGPETVASTPALELIEDRDYPPDFWGDAGDEGVGRR
jgi:hypothetical protein